MADHLRLANGIPLDTRRAKPGRSNTDYDHKEGAHSLRGILEGLESRYPAIFDTQEPSAQETPISHDMGELVLKVTGKFPQNLGLLKRADLTPLAQTDVSQVFTLSDSSSRRLLRDFARQYIESDGGPTKQPDAWQKLFHDIENIALYDEKDRVPEDLTPPAAGDTSVIDIALWPTSWRQVERKAREDCQARVEAICDFIDSFRATNSDVGVLAKDADHPDFPFVRAQVDRATFDALARHPYIEKLNAPISIPITQLDLTSASRPEYPLLPEGEPIGVIDDLVDASHPWLRGVVAEQKMFPANVSFGHPSRHGTHVAGFAAWGKCSDLLNGEPDRQPNPIYVARVAQANENFDPQFVGNPVDAVAEALDWLHSCGVQIVTLPYTYAYPDNGALVSELSAAIDERARANNQVIVISGGNYVDNSGHHWRNDYPKYLEGKEAQVAAPGTAALAVTVGSVAHEDAIDYHRWPGGHPIAFKNQASPFSRTGPVKGSNKKGRAKPEFAGYGGNWGWDTHSSALITNDSNLAVVSLIPPRYGRYFGLVWGTSYAAPQVAHEIARIKTRYPESGANLLRALTALGGDTPPRSVKAGETVYATYGVPRADKVLESDERSVIFVLEGTIRTNSNTIIEIPIPDDFSDSPSEREISVSLAFDPPTLRSRRDYIAGNMSFDFHRNSSLEELKQMYSRQPQRSEVEANPLLKKVDKAPAVNMNPPISHLKADTLITRQYRIAPTSHWGSGGPGYYLVIQHQHSPWTAAQKNDYQNQDFAVAVRIAALEHIDVDLYARAVELIKLRARSRGASQ